jgi:ComF family protein
VHSLTDILRPALNLVLPVRCPCCGVILADEGAFCSECWQQMHFLSPPWCASCANPLPFEALDGQQCAPCMERAPVHDGIRAAVAYDDVSRQVVLKLKHGGKIGLAKLIAKQLARHLPLRDSNAPGMQDDTQPILIAPVPLHWTRLWTRGYNQSALIAQALASQSGLTYAPDILIRTKRTPLLRGMTGKQRAKIVDKAFAIHPKWQDRIKGAHVILIDDVLTSGATSNACIKSLKRNGASWVQLFCWARVLRGDLAQEVDAYPADA